MPRINEKALAPVAGSAAPAGGDFIKDINGAISNFKSLIQTVQSARGLIAGGDQRGGGVPAANNPNAVPNRPAVNINMPPVDHAAEKASFDAKIDALIFMIGNKTVGELFDQIKDAPARSILEAVKKWRT